MLVKQPISINKNIILIPKLWIKTNGLKPKDILHMVYTENCIMIVKDEEYSKKLLEILKNKQRMV